jgi:hypothetical protein
LDVFPTVARDHRLIKLDEENKIMNVFNYMAFGYSSREVKIIYSEGNNIVAANYLTNELSNMFFLNKKSGVLLEITAEDDFRPGVTDLEIKTYGCVGVR